MTSLDQEILESIENIEETVLECQIENMFAAFDLYQKQLTILEYADDVPDEMFFSEFAIFTEADEDSKESEHKVKDFFNTKFNDETGKNNLFGRTTKDGKKEHVIIGLLALLPRLVSGLFNLVFKKTPKSEVEEVAKNADKLEEVMEKNPEKVDVKVDEAKDSKGNKQKVVYITVEKPAQNPNPNPNPNPTPENPNPTPTDTSGEGKPEVPRGILNENENVHFGLTTEDYNAAKELVTKMENRSMSDGEIDEEFVGWVEEFENILKKYKNSDDSMISAIFDKFDVGVSKEISENRKKTGDLIASWEQNVEKFIAKNTNEPNDDGEVIAKNTKKPNNGGADKLEKMAEQLNRYLNKNFEKEELKITHTQTGNKVKILPEEMVKELVSKITQDISEEMSKGTNPDEIIEDAKKKIDEELSTDERAAVLKKHPSLKSGLNLKILFDALKRVEKEEESKPKKKLFGKKEKDESKPTERKVKYSFIKKLQDKNDEKKSIEREKAINAVKGNKNINASIENGQVVQIQIPAVLLLFDQITSMTQNMNKFIKLIKDKILPSIKKFFKYICENKTRDKQRIANNEGVTKKEQNNAVRFGSKMNMSSESVKKGSALLDNIYAELRSAVHIDTKSISNIDYVIHNLKLQTTDERRMFIKDIVRKCKRVDGLMSDMNSANENLNNILGDKETEGSLTYYATWFAADTPPSKITYDITVDEYLRLKSIYSKEFSDKILMPVTQEVKGLSSILKNFRGSMLGGASSISFKDFGKNLDAALKAGTI